MSSALSAGVLSVAVALAVAAVPAAADPAASQRDRFEHQARREMAVTQQEQARTFGPASPACRQAMDRAWSELGHFSDAYETYLLRSDACR